jgi:hypothetical protein
MPGRRCTPTCLYFLCWKRRPIVSNPEFDLQKAHQYFAVSCFNETWNSIDQADRTPEDDETMLQLAMASAWHGSKREDQTPQNVSIAYWLISRVHALCGRGGEAVRYGKLCLDASLKKGVAPFALAYAYEALARGESVLGNADRTRSFLAKARAVAEKLPDEDTRKMLLADLATID